MGKRVLMIAPHMDDIEFTCGATVARWVARGRELFYVSFSSCEKSIPEGFPRDALGHELARSIEMMGIHHDVRFEYPVREFPLHRQEILEDMVALRKDVQPDVVLIPSSFDVHQDHKTVHEECLRAYKHCTLLGYETPWNNYAFRTSYYVEVQPADVDKKIAAIDCYDTQKHRPYHDHELIWSFARFRGLQVNVPLAESFEAIRMVERAEC